MSRRALSCVAVACSLFAAGPSAASPPSIDHVVADADHAHAARAGKRRRIGGSVFLLALGSFAMGIGYYGITHAHDGGIDSLDRFFEGISYGNVILGSVLVTGGAVALTRRSAAEREYAAARAAALADRGDPDAARLLRLRAVRDHERRARLRPYGYAVGALGLTGAATAAILHDRLDTPNTVTLAALSAIAVGTGAALLVRASERSEFERARDDRGHASLAPVRGGALAYWAGAF